MKLSKSESGKLGYEKIKPILDAQREEKVRLAREKYEQNKKNCLNCSCHIPYEKRINNFCNHKCSAIFNNIKRGSRQKESRQKELRQRGIDPNRKCLMCDKTLNRSEKYCSFKCQKDFRIRKAVLNGTASHRTSKAYLLSLYGEKCMECGWKEINPITKKVPIELEHIDGNSDNNDLSNLKILCPNCHSLTPTFKALNKGNGRHKRMKRYKEGKSF